MTAYVEHRGLHVPVDAVSSEESDNVPTVTPPYSWTDDGRLQTDPEGFAPIDEVSPGDYELAADSEVWATGRRGERAVVPDPDKLAAMRRVASRVVAMQGDEALIEAMTEDEIAQARGQARALRDQRRAHRVQLAEAELAEEQAHAAHQRRMRQRDRELAEAVADARWRHRQASDPTHRLVTLSRLSRWLPAAALLPGIASIVLGASNAATQLNRISPDTQLVNWLLEPMISSGVVIILIAQWMGAVPSALHSLKQARRAEGVGGKLRSIVGNGFLALELLLFVLTVLLQVGIHYVGPGADHSLAPLVWAIVPLGLLISMALVPGTSNRLTAALDQAVAASAGHLESTPPTGHTDRAQVGGLMQVSAGASTLQSTPPVQVDSNRGAADPDREAFDEAYARLTEAVQEDWTDPATGRPVDPTSALSIQRTLRVGRERSRQLRNEWKVQHCG